MNQRTGEDTQFFGVVVELWRIGDSLPAPYFKAVATPNQWGDIKRQALSTSARDEQNFEWRRSLIETLRRQLGFSSHRIAQAKSTWLAIERPIADTWYAAGWRNGNPCLELRIHKGGSDGRDWNQQLFESLEQHREDIEAKILESEQGERSVWESTEGRQRSRVAIYRDGNVFRDTESWDEYRDWMIRKLLRFREVFAPYLNEFSAQE